MLATETFSFAQISMMQQFLRKFFIFKAQIHQIVLTKLRSETVLPSFLQEQQIVFK